MSAKKQVFFRISKKAVPKATDRNALKRKIREWFEAQESDRDIVISIYKKVEGK